MSQAIDTRPNRSADPAARDLGIPAEHQRLLDWAEQFAVTEVATRAAQYDRAAALPEEDIAALWRQGLLMSNLPRPVGGLGFGIDCGEPLSFLFMVRNLAHGSSSTAHCYQVHSQCAQVVNFLGTDEQKRRYLQPTRDRGKLLVGVGSEPGRTAKGQFKLLSSADKVAGGYVINGLKNYATNATRAEWILVQVLLKGEEDPAKGLLQFMVRADAPGVSIDASVWNPVGMRACVSPTITFRDVFAPDEDMLGEPGAFVGSALAAKFHLAFSSNFLGSAQAMLRFAQGYIRERGTAAEAHTQILMGGLCSLVSATEELLISAANCWKRGEGGRAASLSNQVKIMAYRCVMEALEKVPYLCGSSALFPKFPLERYVRDMHVHALHDRIERACQLVGAAAFGFEGNFALQR